MSEQTNADAFALLAACAAVLADPRAVDWSGVMGLMDECGYRGIANDPIYRLMHESCCGEEHAR